MVFKGFLFLLIFFFLGSAFGAHHVHTHVQNLNPNASSLLAGIEIPNHSSFNGVSSSSTDCGFTSPEKSETIDGKEPGGGDFDVTKPSVKLHLKHRSSGQAPMAAKESLFDSAVSDLTRIQTLHKRILEKKTRNTVQRSKKHDYSHAGKLKSAEAEPPAVVETYAGKLMGTLKSGVTLGSGEYFMDVFLGTPPKHFSLILDTGSDLNWIQCTPCYDCFEQTGPHYDPNQSSSYRNVSCHDPRCSLVSSPDPPRPCKPESKSQSCPYFYWYGDSSNTTGDFATETFTVNLTTNVDGHKQHHQEVKVENVMFGCGHWNRGLFHGAAGLLGLGRGPLSFASQLQSLYGHSFSYCLVDRNSNSSVSSKLIFGEDKDLLSHPELNFTSLIGGKEAPVDVFYYVHIKSVIVDGETLDIPEKTWDLSPDGFGGTIIDSGTTLSYFADPAYNIIKKSFMEKVKRFPLVNDFPILEPCYNVSGIADYRNHLPSFGILFNDGAVWNFPVENYFIKLEPEEIVCLAVLGTARSALSIIGNYQQQNFHIMYDTKKSRLGFAPTRCADV